MIIEKIRILFNKFLDFVFPEYCEYCNKMLSYPQKVLCKNCLNTAVRKKLHILDEEIGKIKKTWYVGNYDTLNKFVLEAKLNYRKNVLVFFLKFIKSRIINLNEIYSDVDIVIPVPIRKNKLKERRFNQAEIIGEILFENKLQKNVLSKIKETKEQKHLSKEEREKNLKNCFKINDKEKIKNKKILLIDDVITTGSTIREISTLLIENGSVEVYAFSLLKA